MASRGVGFNRNRIWNTGLVPINVSDRHSQTNQRSLSQDNLRIVLLEGINYSAVELITGSGYSNTTRLMKALDGKELEEAIRNTHIIGIRSPPQLTDDAFAKPETLIAVGCVSVRPNPLGL